MAKDEAARLAALRCYCLLDTAQEARFDDLTQLAASICKTPVSLISLVDTNRLFFKSHHGLDAREVPYPEGFCGHAIRQREISRARCGVSRVGVMAIGIAMFPEHGATESDLLRSADAALYQAKAAGRNRVVFRPVPAD